MTMRLYRPVQGGLILEEGERPGTFRRAPEGFSIDLLFRQDDPLSLTRKLFASGTESPAFSPEDALLPPLESQEIWAAGVTYFRSRSARMEEAESAGGDIFYDKVYDAPRPELFFKATASRARGPGVPLGIRSDSTWDVPEPELTLAVDTRGAVFGYTVGNDMSSRSIEGENPLYLPQAKVYRGSCAIGPCLVVGEAVTPETGITLRITRHDTVIWQGSTTVSQIKRSFSELAAHLYRSNEFPDGAYLMTGTGIVPESDFTLAPGDVVSITIDGIGVLTNPIERV